MDIKKILFKTNAIDVEKALPDGVIFCSKDGKIIWVNDKTAEIFETSKMHLLTADITDFIENALSLITNAVVLNKPVITKLEGKEIYFNMTAKEIPDGYVMDFRSSIPAEAPSTPVENKECSEVCSDVNRLLLKLSNDLKSPLQSIVGFSQAMSDGMGGTMSEQQGKYVRIINKNSSELMYFITKLLDMIQVEYNLPSPEKKVFDLTSAVNSVIKYNEQLYKDKNIRWKTEVEEGVKSTTISDEKIVKTVLQNIFEVILKSVEIGDIIVELSVPDKAIIASKSLNDDNYVMISVSSTSLLLSENDLEYMFDPYKIVDTSNKKNLLRAITLYCVKNLVQALGGKIWVESAILKNTTFNFVIPQGKN